MKGTIIKLTEYHSCSTCVSSYNYDFFYMLLSWDWDSGISNPNHSSKFHKRAHLVFQKVRGRSALLLFPVHITAHLHSFPDGNLTRDLSTMRFQVSTPSTREAGMEAMKLVAKNKMWLLVGETTFGRWIHCTQVFPIHCLSPILCR